MFKVLINYCNLQLFKIHEFCLLTIYLLEKCLKFLFNVLHILNYYRKYAMTRTAITTSFKKNENS